MTTPVASNKTPLNIAPIANKIRPVANIFILSSGLDNLPMTYIITAAMIAPTDCAVPNAPSFPNKSMISIAGAVTKKPCANPFNKASDNNLYHNGWNLKKTNLRGGGFSNFPRKHTIEARMVMIKTHPVMIR